MRTDSCLSGMSARQRFRRSAPQSATTPTKCSTTNDAILGVGRDSRHRHPSFLSDADADTLQERNPFHRPFRGMPFRG